MSFDPASFLPYGAQFGGNLAGMIGSEEKMTGFKGRQQGASMGQQMGGAMGIAGGVTGLMGSVTAGVSQIQQGKALKQQGLNIAGRQKQAQAGLDMAASAASMAGPIGMAVAAPLMLISALFNIQGPRKRREKRRQENRRRTEAKHASMRANAAAAGMRMAGGMLRTGGAIGPEPTVDDPTAPVHSFQPGTTYNGR